MARQQPPEPLDLEQLEQTYEVIGELAAREDARQFLAKRREDDAPVVISVFSAPAGDEGNAISHLASDTNRLAESSHRDQLRVIEGRWVGTDAFAVVTERVAAPTLHELLSRRDEEFPYERVAMILREVNAVIEWARSQKFVHRAVDSDTVFVEPGSDRVIVTFAVRPLPRTGMPGAREDARTIASLARAMLTRNAVAPERDERPLPELRPGLPTRVVEETEKLLSASTTREPVPDIGAYIARIAMADELKSAEIHLEKARNAIEEERRIAREQHETERGAHEQQLALERQTHEQQVAEQARRFAKERSDFEQMLATERKALLKEREALARVRAEYDRDHAALAQEREAHERDCAILAEEREQHERLAEERRRQLASATVALAAQSKLSAQYAEEARMAARKAETERHSAQKADAARVAAQRAEAARLVAQQAESDRRATVKIVNARNAPVPPKPTVAKPPKPPKPPKPSGPSWWGQAWANRPSWNRDWNVPAAAVGLLLVIGVFALAMSSQRGSGALGDRELAAGAREVQPGAGAPAPTPSGLTLDSMAGAVVTLPDSTALPAPEPVRRRVVVEPRTMPRLEPRVEPRVEPWNNPAPVTSQEPLPFGRRLDTMIVRIDTIIGGTKVEYRRGGAGAGAAPTRDNPARPDSIRRDTLAPWYIPRRDSTGAPSYF